jgi:WhiB family redox-sensing transcriptional regulator
VSDWRNRAKCRDKDPELWFPFSSMPATEAKRWCRACPVATKCLTHALNRGEDYGVWGGLTEQERRRLVVARIDQSRMDLDVVGALLRGRFDHRAASHAEKLEAVRLLVLRPLNTVTISDMTGIPVIAVERYRRQLREAKEAVAS